LARLAGVAGFEKLCVIKRILPHLADDSRFRQMMIAEAQIVSKMSHTNINQIFELDEIDGQLYMAMEYLEGITVLALIRKIARKTDYLTFQAVIEQPLKDVRTYRRDTPEALVKVLEQALSAEPETRFDTARQFRAAVFAALGVAPWDTHQISEYVQANFTDDI